MNINTFTMMNLDENLASSVMRIMNTQHIISSWSYPYINELFSQWINNAIWALNQNVYVENQANSWSSSSFINDQVYTNLYVTNYCTWNETSTNDDSLQSSFKNSKLESKSTLNKEKCVLSKNFKTYQQLKKVSKKSNPEITKEEMYDRILARFKHEKAKIWNDNHTKFKIIYICKYGDWCKVFDKIWNMIDHVRMHENIKPYTCKIWGSSFTQK